VNILGRCFNCLKCFLVSWIYLAAAAIRHTCQAEFVHVLLPVTCNSSAVCVHSWYVVKETATSLTPGSGEIVIQDRLIKWVKVYIYHFNDELCVCLRVHILCMVTPVITSLNSTVRCYLHVGHTYPSGCWSTVPHAGVLTIMWKYYYCVYLYMPCQLMYWHMLLIYMIHLPVSGLLSPWCLGAGLATPLIP